MTRSKTLALFGLVLSIAPGAARTSPPPSLDAPAAVSVLPGTTLRRAQQAEWIQGDLESARSLYEEVASAAGEVGQEAMLGLARTLRKQGRLDEARARLAAVQAAPVPTRLRAQVLAERSRLDRPGTVQVEVTPVPAKGGERRALAVTVGAAAGPETVSLELRDARLGDVARSLASGAGANVVVTPAVADQRVSVSLKAVPALQALDQIARSAGARMTSWNGVCTVGTPDELARMRLEPGREGVTAAARAPILVALKLYGTDGKGAVKLVANPRVMAVDGTTARITVGGQPAGSSAAGAPPSTGGPTLEYDVKVTPCLLKGTDQIHLDLDASVATSEKQGGRVRVHQRRQKVEIRVKDGEPFRFAVPSGDSDVRQIEVQAFSVK